RREVNNRIERGDGFQELLSKISWALVVWDHGTKLQPVRPIAPGVEEIENLDSRIGMRGENGNRASGTHAKHADMVHIHVTTIRQIIQNQLHVMHATSQGLDQLADEPLLHGPALKTIDR